MNAADSAPKSTRTPAQYAGALKKWRLRTWLLIVAIALVVLLAHTRTTLPNPPLPHPPAPEPTQAPVLTRYAGALP